MIRSVLFVRPVAGDHSSIQQFFEQEQVLERAAQKPGFLSAELQQPTDGGDLTLVTALWESENGYQGWVEDPWRAAICERGARVFQPLETDNRGARYEVAIAVAPTAPAGHGGHA
ncbi:MAG: antibiotic biosynthesis monooxygenase family protein [Acidimicrobiales bacterium]